MVEYLRIPCPNCQHLLRVRKQYIGIEVTCTRCDCSFVVEEPHEDIAAGNPDDSATASREIYESQISELKNDLDRVRKDFARVATENAHAAEQLQKLSERHAEREARLSDLERSLTESQEVIRQSEALIRLESINTPESMDPSQEDPSHEAVLPPLAQEIRRLKAERHKLLDAEKEYQQELEGLRSQLDRVTQDANDSSAQQQAAHESIKQELGELKVERHQLIEAEKEYQQEHQRLRSELDRVTQDANDSSAQQQAAHETVKHELELLRRNWDMEREAHNQQMAQEQGRIELLQAQIQRLESAARDNSSASELDRVSHELEQAQQRTSQLELELANLREAKATPGSLGEPTDLKRQVEDLNMQLQDALNENERLRMTIGQLGIGFG